MSLRKRTVPPLPLTTEKKDEDIQNLYVFGYQCKLFRDDEKALYIEQNKHLIPWMGEANLLIDRYDGRGHLHDLRPYDADRRPAKPAKLSEEERQLEAACDEERYMELHSDWMEKILYEEEELKRLHEALAEDSYGAVGFSYDQSNVDATQQQQDEDEEDNESEEYEPPPELHVPPEFVIPETVNMNAIIEKTATFISKHGTQMEIMIKTRQKDNAQFDFLNYDNALFPFYRHMVHMIKCGRYKPGTHSRQHSRRKSSSCEDSGYLHPSLVKVPSSSDVTDHDPEAFMRIISEKLPAGQISNTPYAALVQRLGKHTGRDSPHLTSDKVASKPAPSTVMSYPAVPLDVDINRISNHTATYNHMETEHRSLPPVPGMEPVVLPPTINATTSSVTVPWSTATVHNSHHSDLSVAETTAPPPPPAPDVQLIIDKMASYVAKNGPEFEIVVKSKTDPRFEFLQTWHTHYAYYEHKKKLYLQEIQEASQQAEREAEGDEEDESEEEEMDSEDSQFNASKAAVSFSIKPKDVDSTTLAAQRAVLYESSDDETKEDEDGTDATETSETTVEQGEAGKKMERKPALSAEQMEKRQAEERLRDRLAGAARDKMAQTSKDKQLKAERKRKAAMFISLLRGGGEQQTAGADAASSDASDVTVTAAGSSHRCSRANSPQLYTVDTPSASLCTHLHPTDLYVESRPTQLYLEDTPHYADRYRPLPPPPPSRSLYMESDRPQLYLESYPEPPDYPRSPPDRYPPRREPSPREPSSRSGRKSRRHRSRSPTRSRRRKRSKTPPSAYNVLRRSSKSPARQDLPRPAKRRHSRSKSREKSALSRNKRSRSRSPSKRYKSSKHSSKSSKSKSSRHKKSRHRSRSPNSRRTKGDSSDENAVTGDKKTDKRSRSASADDCIIIDDEPAPISTPTTTTTTTITLTSSPPPAPLATAVVINHDVTNGTDTTVVEPSSDTPVPEDLMSKVRAILKASRGES